MRQALILYAHPDPRRSRVNQKIKNCLEGLDGAMVRDLYDLYPDFYIDVEVEQELLKDADLIAFVHPFYWYGSPSILKEWQDTVLSKGFAYGPGGESLKGKEFLLVVSAGATESAYTEEGAHELDIDEFLKPQKQMAKFCKMIYQDPIVIYGSHVVDDGVVEQHVNRVKEYFSRFLIGQ